MCGDLVFEPSGEAQRRPSRRPSAICSRCQRPTDNNDRKCDDCRAGVCCVCHERPPADEYATMFNPSVLCAECGRRRAEESARYDRVARMRSTVHGIPSTFRLVDRDDPLRVITLDSPALLERVHRHDAIVEAKAALDATVVLLHGPTGAGKTSLAAAMIGSMAAQYIDGASKALWTRLVHERDREFSGLCWTTAKKLSLARGQHKLGGGEAPLVEQASECGLLVLDDLGQEADWSAVYDVIDARYTTGKPTIVTTFLTWPAIKARYGDGMGRRLTEDRFATKIGLAASPPAP